MVNQVRRPGLLLRGEDDQPVELKTWANELLQRFEAIAELLDAASGSDEHRQSLQAQRGKVADPDSTPSARVLREMRERQESFSAFALRLSREHDGYFRSHPLNAQEQARFEKLAAQSIADQAELEQTQVGDFDTFVGAYQASILGLSH